MSALSQVDKLLLFDYLFDYECNIKLHSGKYDIADTALREFLDSNNIVIDSYCNRNKNKIHTYTNYLLFSSHSNHKLSGKDKVHHLLRHIRNSVAHSLIDKEKRKWFVLTDKNSNGSENMIGKIRYDLLPSLIAELKKTKQL